MDARPMQRLIGINIAHASQEVLIEQQRLHHRVPRAQARDERVGGERKWIRS